MTAIVGLKAHGKVFMGGDSAGVNVSTYDMQTRSDPKVFVLGEAVFGFTSSFRMGQLLRFNLTMPELPEKIDLLQYMVTKFIPAVRDCLKAGGYARKENEVESGGQFLVGFRGRLFFIESDYQVGEVVDDFAACGCAANLLQGAMAAVHTALSPKEKIELALTIATRYSAMVRGPFTVVST